MLVAGAAASTDKGTERRLWPEMVYVAQITIVMVQSTQE
jgi:hypothetical protein